ncbi:glycosyltransferase family 4 protein [Ponticaulis sp.]|uniref:glycosyltransferase family 4 protein n=1 Tax=Ponticaulis sp. TaxID=2020902 RepID=UPI000B71A20B|nr:glycosyltransferase family 4 protein [Ponticaulis sp.]MAI90963.1 hypothetical protein [Ponticaulis sp.]OUX98304.1 MAG: hypothetical protein CBB65_11000 [Hyphomonadaceae bacterium TMED5]|tara:strand:+ start:178568 stop:179785 length:1218 start_codon:yes stop_codon:yes gene_type:complete
MIQKCIESATEAHAFEGRLILTLAAYFPDSYGGAERQAKILAEALGRKGIDVTLVAPTIDPDVALNEQTDFGRIIRKRLAAYPNFGGKHMLSFLRWTYWFPKRFASAEWRGVPIYCFHSRLHALGPALCAEKLGSPLLIKLGGGGEASEFDALRTKKFFYGRWVERFLRKRVDAFVANSQEIALELRDLGISEEKIAEFPNGVALPGEDALSEAMSLRIGNAFSYAGRLITDKSVDVLYDAACLLFNSGETDFKLELIGTGAEKDRIEAEIQGTEISACINLPGFATDIYEAYKQADFFVCASRREGQSNALLEAMSIGLIPIVFAASGVEEVVEDGLNGYLVKECTPAAFLEKMRMVLSMSAEQRREMSAAARQFAEDNISIDAVALRTIDAIKACQARRTSTR